MTVTNLRPVLLVACLAGLAAPMQVSAAAVHTIDVLGVYSSHAAALMADPKAAFVSNIEYANKALQNSGANYRYNLVRVEQRDWPDDSGIGSSQLYSLVRDPAIQALREEYGADIVAGVVPTSNGYCGIGYLPPANSSTHEVYAYAKQYGYSLSGHSCGGRTMAHEMGHNLGLGHSAAQGSSGTVATWGRGHGIYNSFVTVMAYESAFGIYSSAGRLQIHSNPDISVCNGQSCGVSSSNTWDGADAVQALNLASPQVSQWMDSVVSVPQNSPPVAKDDSASTDAGKTVSVNVVQNDSDPDNDTLTLGAVGKPQHGTAVLKTDGKSIAYTPENGFDGSDSFTYTVMDGRGGSAQAKVSIQVNPVATTPPPGGGGGADGELVVNGGAELGLQGWSADSGASIQISNVAQSGGQSIRASANSGRGVAVDMVAPFEVDTNLKLTTWVKGKQWDVVYVYLRAKQNGVWRYHYLTARMLSNSEWYKLEANRYISGGNVSDAQVYLRFTYGANDFLIDGVDVELQ